jgi:hypothetical protein
MDIFGKIKGNLLLCNTNAFTKIHVSSQKINCNKSLLSQIQNEIIDFDFWKDLQKRKYFYWFFSESKKVYAIIDQENYKVYTKINRGQSNSLIVMELFLVFSPYLHVLTNKLSLSKE